MKARLWSFGIGEASVNIGVHPCVSVVEARWRWYKDQEAPSSALYHRMHDVANTWRSLRLDGKKEFGATKGI
jgi:hypothetical protein